MQRWLLGRVRILVHSVKSIDGQCPPRVTSIIAKALPGAKVEIRGVCSRLGASFQAAAQSWSNVSPSTAERMTSIRSAPGRDQRMPGPVRRALYCLIPLSTVPEPMG
jgi:hypothetical protein